MILRALACVFVAAALAAAADFRLKDDRGGMSGFLLKTEI